MKMHHDAAALLLLLLILVVVMPFFNLPTRTNRIGAIVEFRYWGSARTRP